MDAVINPILDTQLQEVRDGGLYKDERVIVSPQGATIRVGDAEVLNFCANNYLGLSSDPRIIAAAHAALDSHGYGLSSVRFICGTQDIHKQLEASISTFFGTDDTILYTSCFDANGGLFETLLTKEDAIISDELNHASIIDGVRLCKAQRYRYKNADMDDLKAQLEAADAAGARVKLIATDGVFSMDGTYAPLDTIADLADQYNALIMVDESHATGFVGTTGRGTPEKMGVQDRIDIITSTLGKAMGGASGGFTTGRARIVEWLRQRSRPYLFSNTVPPAIVGAAQAAFAILSETTELRDRLEANTVKFRDDMRAAGFDVPQGDHPIAPIMLGDAKLAADMARDLLAEGIYVIGFSFPVVPKGKARIRVQLSAAHSDEDIAKAVAAFSKVGRAHGVLS